MNDIHSVWNKVDIRGSGECWPWTGYTSNGRGRMDLLGKKGIYAPRIAYISAVPYAPIGLHAVGRNDLVLHKCDNSLCCNPDHLYIGSHDQNMKDKVERNRCPDFKGHKGPRAKLTEDDVRDVRLLKLVATKKALAVLFDVSLATISGCLYGRHYTDIS